MFYSSTDPYFQILFGLIAILFITLLFWVILSTYTPQERKALLNIFGLKQEDILSAPKEKQIEEGIVSPKSIRNIFILLIVGMLAIYYLLPLQPSDKIIVILTFALMVFAGIEGLSTYMQLWLGDRKNLIEDARNELEKAYSPLFFILNYNAEDTTNLLRIRQEDFKRIEEIMATYSWVIPEINDLWKETRRPMPSLHLDEQKKGLEPRHDVSLEFREKVNKEFKLRAKRYNELLKKK
jgi:hypothetical protein